MYVNVNFRENLGGTHFHWLDILKNLVSLSAIHSYHSHKKRKDSLEGSLDLVLVAAELEFPKILVPRLPQHTSDVKIEYTVESHYGQNNCIIYRDQLLGALTHFNFIILILICFLLTMSGVNYIIYGCYSARTTPEVSLHYRSFLTLERNIITVINQNREIDDNLERQIKNKTLLTCRLFLLT